MSLWRQICFSTPAWRTPSIIELWFQRVRQDQAVRQQLGDGRNAGLVRHVARGEHQRRLLAVQVGKLGLQFNQRMIGAGDIARAARARAHARRGLDHRADHLRVLPHAEIVVGAPDHDVPLALRRMPERVREPAGDALEIGEHAVAPLVMQGRQGAGEKWRRSSSKGSERADIRNILVRLSRAYTAGPASGFEFYQGGRVIPAERSEGRNP